MRGVEFAWDAERPRALIMGIVNVTPDSFADGGRYLDPAAAVRQARALAAEGADLLDVGAESTRPGLAGGAGRRGARASPAGAGAAPRRPAVPGVGGHVEARGRRGRARARGPHGERRHGPRRRARARARVRGARRRARGHAHAGDASHDAGRSAVRRPPGGGAGRPRGRGRPARRRPAWRPSRSAWTPASGSARRWRTISRCSSGSTRSGRSASRSWSGPSRKSFIGALLDHLPPAERLEGTLAACVMAVMAGAHIVRVHDVAAVRRAVRVAEAIRDAAPG